MRIHSIFVVGVTLATMTLLSGSPVAAGGGVQLNFGGPLGSFTARPHGGHGHYDRGPLRRAYKADHARLKAAAAPKAAGRHSRMLEARKLATRRRQAAAEQKPAAKRVEGGIEVGTAKRARETMKIETAVGGKLESVTQAVQIARSDKSLETDAVATPEAAPVARAIAAVVEDLPDGESLEARQSCKRFVPSAGLTITVPCGE